MRKTEKVELTVLCMIEDGDKLKERKWVKII